MRSWMAGTVLVVLALAGAGSVLAGGLDHAAYDSILKDYSSDGLVDYRSLKQDSTRLLGYLNALKDSSALHYDTWDRQTQMAFWINAYNAVTMYAIITNYPIQYGGLIARLRFPKSSIRQIKRVWATPYFELAGRSRSLDEIEHGILRGTFDDPRIHFALVCASIGCPVLRREAYAGERLESQLEDDTRRFIEDTAKVRLDREGNNLYVSSIFDWYAEDFRSDAPPAWLEPYDKKYRGFMAFLVEYLDEDVKEHIGREQPRIEFLEYDWSLNDMVKAE